MSHEICNIQATEMATNELLEHLISNYQYFSIEDRKFKNENKFKGDKQKIQRIQRITDYIYKNYRKKISLSEIAEKEFISVFHLSHLIKQATGKSFQEFLSFVRVEQSECLLIGTAKSIVDIAYECGFSDPRYYRLHFFEWYGFKPVEYRKKFKGETLSAKPPSLSYFDVEKADAVLHKVNFNTKWFDTKDQMNLHSDERIEPFVIDLITNQATISFYVEVQGMADNEIADLQKLFSLLSDCRFNSTFSIKYNERGI